MLLIGLRLYVGVAGKRHKPLRIFIIPLIVLAAIFFLILAIVIYLLRRTRGRAFPGEWLITVILQENEQNSSPRFSARGFWPIVLNFCSHVLDDQDDITAESMYFDFKTLRTATGNFCQENKLGQGGFGPVYRVILLLNEKYFIILFFFTSFLAFTKIWDLKVWNDL